MERLYKATMSEAGSDVPMLSEQDIAEAEQQEVPFTKVTYEKRGRASMGRDKAKVTRNNSMTMVASFKATQLWP